MKDSPNYRRKLNMHLILQILMVPVLILIDQLTKYLAASSLKSGGDLSLIKGLVNLHYLENQGAAFGIFTGRFWLFYVITVVILILLTVFYCRIHKRLQSYCSDKTIIPDRKTIRNQLFLCDLLCLLASGAIGNFIDRILRGYVIDFISLQFISFPVFNLADIYVTISAVMIVIFFLFIYKEDRNFHLWG